MTLVLIVEDDPKIRANLLFQLREHRLQPTAVESAEAAIARLGEAGSPPPDLLLLDVRLPGRSGVELVRELAAESRLPPTIILSGEASISETVEALRLGVHDFIEKPFSKERLLQAVDNALEHTALRRRVGELESALDQEHQLLGEAPAMDALRDRIARAAPTDGRILILGESGVGKELVADAIHRGSPRKDGPFIKLNCAAIPDTMIEDELFGHAKGAFTDARVAKAGLFEEADGGTLFLDEIGDMAYALQSRLLRVLEDGRVRRVGETQDRTVDVRLVAATHRDLEAAVAEGTFREDLYFRIAHLPIPVPPLRERSEDVALLFSHFLDRFSRRHRMRRPEVEPELLERLRTYRWPGNVRELRNLAERLLVFGGNPLTVEHLPTALLQEESGPSQTPSATDLLRLEGGPLLPLRDFRTRCEREYIEAVLQRTGWNVAAAARALGLQRTYLHQKLTDLGLERPGRASDSVPEDS